MKHLDSGRLRAYYDGALPASEHKCVEEHLAACSRCAQRASRIEARGERVQTWLDSTADQRTRPFMSSQQAHARLRTRLTKEIPMKDTIFAPRRRPAWIAAALLAVFLASFAFAPVRAWAGQLLALFRVQRIEFVTVDTDRLPDEDVIKDTFAQLQGVMQDQITVQVDGERQKVDESTARSMRSFARFPAALDGTPQITIEPSMHAEMTVDLALARTLLDELGYDVYDLPDALDGAEISVDLSSAVRAVYGDCDTGEIARRSSEWSDSCLALLQFPSPEVSAPSELDLDQLGQAYLQLLGMDPDEAARYSKRVDWTTTLIVPLPDSVSLSYKDVTVDGVPGTLIRSPRYRQNYALTWIKNDIVYGLLGTGSDAEALEIAASLQ